VGVKTSGVMAKNAVGVTPPAGVARYFCDDAAIDARVTAPLSDSTLAARGVVCRICGGSSGSTHAVREMMFGSGEVFHYFACGQCGCVQLIDAPADLSRFYPADYYSYAAPAERSGVRGLFRRYRNRGTFASHREFDGATRHTPRALERALPYPIPGASDWMARLGAHRESRILDVGSGSGALLLDLASAGYTRLVGADPFIANAIAHPSGVRILKRALSELDEMFDVIMLHHAFEHMPDPSAALNAIASHLAPDGTCLMRIPTTSSWAWEHYREHWVQLDAPRHFFIHSRRSIALLAERSGLEIVDVVDDSTEFQFTGSELYQRGRSLSELATAYSRAELREYRRRADQLNREHRGDQAAFYLRRSSSVPSRSRV
jgi:SAM-dependent methyltransferase